MPKTNYRPGPVHHNFFLAHFKAAEDVRFLMMVALTAAQLAIFDLDSIRVESSDLLDRFGLKGRYSDLIISIRLKSGGEVRVSFLIEHKSSPDRDVMRQLLAYMEALYADGAQAVVPVVVYHGKSRWREEKTFRAFVHGGLSAEFMELFEEFLIDFKAVFVDLGNARIRERFAKLPADKQVALQALSQIWDADARTVAGWLDQLRVLGGKRRIKAVASILSYFANAASSIKIDAVERELKAIRPGDKAMLDVMKVWNGALPNTFQEAIDAGFEHGREEGREEGSQSERLKLAERLLAEAQMPDAKVAKLADLPLPEVRRLKGRARDRGRQ